MPYFLSLESIVSIAGAFSSALFAWLSYRAGNRQRIERQDERLRDIQNEVSRIVSEISIDGTSCEELIDQAKISYQTLFSLSNMTGNSLLPLYIQELTSKNERIVQIVRSTNSIGNSVLRSKSSGEDEARDGIVRLRKFCKELQAIIQAVQQKHQSNEEQIAPLRARALSGKPA